MRLVEIADIIAQLPDLLDGLTSVGVEGIAVDTLVEPSLALRQVLLGGIELKGAECQVGDKLQEGCLQLLDLRLCQALVLAGRLQFCQQLPLVDGRIEIGNEAFVRLEFLATGLFLKLIPRLDGLVELVHEGFELLDLLQNVIVLVALCFEGYQLFVETLLRSFQLLGIGTLGLLIGQGFKPGLSRVLDLFGLLEQTSDGLAIAGEDLGVGQPFEDGFALGLVAREEGCELSLRQHGHARELVVGQADG